MTNPPRTALMLIALVGMTWISACVAETNAANEAPAPAANEAPATKPVAYNDAELKKFADAALDVVRIKAAYAQVIAQKMQEQQEARQAASQEMEEAVKQHGMSVEKYQEILTNIQADPDLAGRVDKHLSEAVQTKHPEAVEPKDPSGDDILKKKTQQDV